MNESDARNKQNPLKDKSFQFALKVINLYKFLTEQKREYIMSKQLLRSGTSIGANIREGQNAQSKADFIHKFSIAQKECDETLYWLELLHQSDFLEEKEFKAIHNDATELLKMLRSSILTSKQNIHHS
jgi:four helix bundle protein